MTIESISATAAIANAEPLLTSISVPHDLAVDQGINSFANMMLSKLAKVESTVANANTLVQQFAVDDSVPVHKVTYALEEARLAVEMMVQVRTRLVEGYREIMNMQV